MSIFLASIASTERNARNANLLTDINQLRDPIIVVGSVEPGGAWSEETSSFYVTGARKDDRNRQITLYAFSLQNKYELSTRQAIVN